MPRSGSLKASLLAEARALGFASVGVAPATEADTFPQFEAWLDAGLAGSMDYLARKRAARRHPQGILPAVKSVVMMAYHYGPPSWDDATMTGLGRVAAYSCRGDYHLKLWPKLNRLADWLAAEAPGTVSRGVADTAPLLERDFARRAGLGWFGKNTLLLNKSLGSFTLLAGLLTTAELEPDPPHTLSHCGTCTRCLEACPTQAFVAPGVLDARKCISYLTIELDGAIPLELRPQVGDWLMGCDVCQTVCPWNRHSEPNPAFPADPALVSIDCGEVLRATEAELNARFHGTPLGDRGRARKLRRNAAIVLGNVGTASVLSLLREFTADADPVVAEAAAWAVAQIGARHGKT